MLSMTENLSKSQAFKLKGRLYTFTVLQVTSAESDLFAQQLASVIQKAPKLFAQTPVVLDLAAVNHADCDLANLCAIIREQGIIPVAIQGGSPALDTVARAQGLAVLQASSAQDKMMPEINMEPHVIENAKSRLLTSPVRSGQQVVAKGGDLVVTAAVSHGAELLADGNIHVYGALRGRALAGISGDKNARIFCQSLEAELVSIAGYYRLSDAIEPVHQPCQIYLENEHILIEVL